MKFIIFILLFEVSHFSWAAAGDCRTVDYTQALGPTRNQGETSWCFAHSSADLVSQHLKKRISAMDLATNYHLTDLNKIRNHKNPVITKWVDDHPGFYSRTEHWRTEDPLALSADRILSYQGLLYLGGLDQDAILMTNLKGFCLDSELPGNPEGFNAHLQKIQELKNDAVFVNACLSESKRMSLNIGTIRDEKAADSARIFQCYVDSQCKNRIKTKKPLLAEVFEFAGSLEEYKAGIDAGKINKTEARKKLFEKVDQVLNQGKILSMGWDEADIQDQKGAGPADHASIIAGRKMMDGVCKYRIRDSFGADCSGIQSHIASQACDPQTGDVWVTKEQLPSIYSLIWIK